MRWSQNVLPIIGMQVLWCTSMAQGPLALDTSFRCPFNDWYVNSALALEDGNVLLSGRIRLPSEFEHKTLVLVGPSGERVETFYNSGLGGGRITAWNNRYYVATTQTVRRILPSGHLDPDFAEMNSDPTFGSLQGGDYHVYPDGRVLLTGFHQLLDEEGNWIMHSLIWFTDSGWVDHGQSHRRSNAPIYQIEEEPDGQFLCFYTGTEYEGQATNGRIFRINADGSLDTTLESRVGSGTIFSLLPLPDGRFYASGFFTKPGVAGTIRLARFLPNGRLDPTFDNAIDFQRGDIPGNDGAPTVSPIQPWRNGEILIMGVFQTVNGQPRGGVCVVDSTGEVTDAFANCSVGGYVYEGFHYQGTTGYLETPDGMAYIWGAYHGYDDGTTNDTLQRFVTRLYGPDWPTAVQEEAMEGRQFNLYPNPTSGLVQYEHTFQQHSADRLFIVRDAEGRVVREVVDPPLKGSMDLRGLAPGSYVVQVFVDGVRSTSEKIILLP